MKDTDKQMSNAGMVCDGVLCKEPTAERGREPTEALTGTPAAIGDVRTALEFLNLNPSLVEVNGCDLDVWGLEHNDRAS
jgi:hypothetical protein